MSGWTSSAKVGSLFRVKGQRLHRDGYWLETITTQVFGINEADAIDCVEKPILEDGDDCLGFAAVRVG